MAAPKPERSPTPINSEERYVAARAIYEGTPGMTLAKVAEQVGMSKGAIENRANKEGWKKNHVMGKMTEVAQRAADAFKMRVAELGPEADPGQKQLVVAEIVEETAIDLRAKILDRHRREWAAPRAMSAEAVAIRDTDPEKSFNRAKLAKITAETLKIVQDGERKAWGIDVGELPPGSVVIIEREPV